METQKRGFEKLTDEQNKEFQKLFDEFDRKVSRKFNNVSCKITLKEHEKGGSKRYIIEALIQTKGKRIEAQEEDWDFKKALHILFKKLLEEIEHKFHFSDQNRKS